MLLVGLGQLKNFKQFVGSRTHDSPTCSVVAQPITLQRAPPYLNITFYTPYD
jgi:hypothetical protein